MAKTPTERINELDVLAARLDERLGNVRIETQTLSERMAAAEKAATDARTEVAILRQNAEELKKSMILWSNRWWTILTIVVGCLLTSLFALLRK